MEIRNILIFLLVFYFASTNEAESSVALVALDYKIKLIFVELIGGSNPLYRTTGIVTITAEARVTSNQVPFSWNYLYLDSRSVNVTNLSERKTILTSNVANCEEDWRDTCVFLKDFYRAGDHLEIVVNGQFKELELLTYKYYNTSNNRMEEKIYGVYRPYASVPRLSYLDATERSSYPRVRMQFTLGLGGSWEHSHKIIGSMNSLRETNASVSNTLWTHFENTPPIDIDDVAFFISDFVSYTISTERNTKVSVWGPASVIFENGTTYGTPTAFANFIVSFASSLLNNCENTLDMKYPLDGLQILFSRNHNWKDRILGQIYLDMHESDFPTSTKLTGKSKQHIKKRLPALISKQFFKVMVGEPLDEKMGLAEYLEQLCRKGIIEEEFYPMNLLKMMETFLPPEIVLNGIRIYAKSQIWKRATKNDFFDAVKESISRQNATHLFLPEGVRVNDVIGNYNNSDIFNFQVNASLLPENNQIQLHLAYKAKEDFTPGIPWWMPVQVRIALRLMKVTEILEETFWIPPNTSVHSITRIGGHTLTNSSEIRWFLVNKNVDGIYGTFYDRKLLSLLVSQLNKNCSIFSARERYNILFNGATIYKKIRLEHFFLLTSYFGQESEILLFGQLIYELLKSGFLLIGNDDAYKEVRKHFVPKMESFMESKGGLAKIVNSEKGIDWGFQHACLLLRAPSCLRFASENFKIFELSKSYEREEQKWSEAAGADPQNFEYLKERFLNLSDGLLSDYRQPYFNALQWLSNDTLYESFLNSVLEKNSEALDFYAQSLFNNIAFSESRLALLVNFAKTKFEEGRISSRVFQNIVMYVLRQYCLAEFVADIKLYEDLKLFINQKQGKLERDHYSSLKSYFSETDEKVYNQEAYWNKHGKKFLLWLKKFNEENYKKKNVPSHFLFAIIRSMADIVAGFANKNIFYSAGKQNLTSVQLYLTN